MAVVEYPDPTDGRKRKVIECHDHALDMVMIGDCLKLRHLTSEHGPTGNPVSRPVSIELDPRDMDRLWRLFVEARRGRV